MGCLEEDGVRQHSSRYWNWRFGVDGDAADGGGGGSGKIKYMLTREQKDGDQESRVAMSSGLEHKSD